MAARLGAVLAAFVWMLGAAAVWAADRSEVVTITPGVPFVQVAGSLSGWDVVHYRVDVAAGQQIRVQLSSDQTSTNFNILPPAGNGGAIFQGVTGGNVFVGRLQASGVYTITVFQNGAAAANGRETAFALALSVTGRLQGGEALSPPVRQTGSYVTVFGLGQGGLLPLRRDPAANATVRHRVENGQRLLLRQCRMERQREWCFVTSQRDLNVRGWAEGVNLRNE